MNPTAQLPDNLKARVSRLSIARKSFTDDSGKSVDYNRLVLEFLVKGEPAEVEFKIDKKDIMLLKLADVVESEKAF